MDDVNPQRCNVENVEKFEEQKKINSRQCFVMNNHRVNINFCMYRRIMCIILHHRHLCNITKFITV